MFNEQHVIDRRGAGDPDGGAVVDGAGFGPHRHPVYAADRIVRIEIEDADHPERRQRVARQRRSAKFSSI